MTVFGGDPILAEDYNDLLERENTSITTADSATWNATEASIITVTASLISGQRYKIWFTGKTSTDVAADASNIRIREDNLAGTQLQLSQVYLPTTSSNGWQTHIYAEYTAVSTASKTFALTAQRSAGTGTAHRFRASSSAPCFFAVEKVVS